jgi:hypothetical protein
MIIRRDVFQAIADPTRRAILTLLMAQTMTAESRFSKLDGILKKMKPKQK